MIRVAVLRCGKLPSFITWEIPNPERVFVDDELLVAGFRARGIDARSVVWSDPDVEWEAFDVALIRSTWDYLDEKDAFLEVLGVIEASSCTLYNPLAAVQWNLDKRYLLELEQAGVATIPTHVAGASDLASLSRELADRGDGTVILKPTVGLAGSYSTRTPARDLEATLAVLRADDPEREYLVQPYIDDIATEGEWSFIYFNRRLSHVLLKRAAPGDYRVQTIYGGTIVVTEPSERDRRRAAEVMDAVPHDSLYARLDFVRVAGELAIMEVELIEPILSFELAPAAVDRLVDATVARHRAGVERRELAP